MEINEINEPCEDMNMNENQLCFVEEPDEERFTNQTDFICSDNTIFEKMDTIEINEYESDLDSESDEPIRTQYIVSEIICSKGDQSFVIIQRLSDKSAPKDLRKITDNNSILKLQNEMFEQFSTISNDAIPLDVIDYIETVFSSFPAINASYLSAIQNEDYDKIENKVQKFKLYTKINSDESINFYDGMINWQQAFHGFNVIEDAQNERINELIYQIISKILSNMPDIIVENKEYPKILDEEVMRIYQLLPLYHMFRMTTYCDKSQTLINLYANAILKLSTKGVNCLKIWWSRMNQRYFKNLIEIFKRSIKINLYEQV